MKLSLNWQSIQRNKVNKKLKEVWPMFNKTYVSMDITGSDVRVTSVRKNKVIKWGSAPLPGGTVKDGIITDPQTASLVINDLFRSMKLRKNRVISTVTGLPFIYRVINMPRIENQAPDEALERAARREMSLKEEDIYLIWQLIATEANGQESDYLVIGVPKAATKPFMETLTKAEIKPYILDVKPLALARIVSSADAILASLEKNYIDIIIVSNGLVRVMHGFAANKAENTESIVNDFADGLSKSVNSFNRDYPQNAIRDETPLYLSGELAANMDVLKLIQEISEHPVHVVDTPLIVPEGMSIALYASNLGLALKKLPGKITSSETPRYSDIDLNLLSSIYKPFRLRFKWAYAIAGALIMALVAILFSAYTLRTDAMVEADSLRSKSTKIAQQLKEAQKVNQELVAARKEKSDSLKKMQEALNTMKDEHLSILGLRHEYAYRFGLIINALPQGAEFKTIIMNESNIEITGEAKSALDVLKFTEALERNGTFSTTRVGRIEPIKNSDKVSFAATITE